MNIPAASDSELLAAWVAHRSESAFHDLVERYAALVQMAAKRTCGDDSLAAEASQLVFILLAQKAKSLIGHPTLAGWLHVTAVMKSRDLIDKARRENRKRQLMQSAMENETVVAPYDVWQEMQPVLDEALAALSTKDREAILLRFYRSFTVREIAATLGIANDAAQKRIDRATERLRGKLTRHGCKLGGSLSAAMIAGFAADAQATTLPASLIASKAVATGALSAGFFTPALISFIAVMKTTSFTIPTIALICSAALIATQHHSISKLERQSSVLQKAINARSSSSLAGFSADKRTSAAKTETDNEAFDWKKIAELFRQQNRIVSPGDRIRMEKLQQRFRAMSEVQLNAALDEIAALDLPKSYRDLLESIFINMLIEKYPQFALNKYIDRAQGSDSWIQFELAMAMGEWAKKDSASAIAWFDEQIASGKFDSKSLDGKSRARLEFEGRIFSSLLNSDPDAAKRRLNSLPEDQQNEVLSKAITGYINEENQIAFAELVRNRIQDKHQVNSVLSQHASFLVRGENGYQKVSAYLERIQATPSERGACLQQAVESQFQMITQQKKVTREDLDTMREWVTSQAPESTADITGKALASAINPMSNLNFSEAANLALEYNSASGNDE
ncbi:MAG: RNA polymerase sigma factor, partial [Verrucomicrobia bacterium]